MKSKLFSHVLAYFNVQLVKWGLFNHNILFISNRRIGKKQVEETLIILVPFLKETHQMFAILITVIIMLIILKWSIYFQWCANTDKSHQKSTWMRCSHFYEPSTHIHIYKTSWFDSFLGVLIDKNLSWNPHISLISSKIILG